MLWQMQFYTGYVEWLSVPVNVELSQALQTALFRLIDLCEVSENGPDQTQAPAR